MHIFEMEYLIEWDLKRIVQAHFPLDWKEDAITHELAICFRDHFHDTTLHGARHPLNIEWEIYKLHGTRETSFGDIGLLIRYKLPTGAIIEGAGFMEAKIRGRDSIKFHQVRHEQVTRLLARSAHTRLLLYDYNPVAVLDSDFDHYADWDFFPHSKSHRFNVHSLVTHGPTLPLQLAAAINQYDDTLYRFCHSLSQQFTRRYFNLHDLDFSDQAVQAVKGFPSDLGSPNIVMVIHVAPEGQKIPEKFSPSQKLYGHFEKQ